jgi:glycosyltransferase involved in cell wall biosynthesis
MVGLCLKSIMPGPLSIAHVVFSLEPGGMENGVVNLSNGLEPERFVTTILCLEHGGAFVSRLKPGIRVEAFGRKKGFDRAAVMKLARWLRRERPDVIHTHNLGPLIYALLARMLSGRWSIPVLHGEHGALQGDDLDPRRLKQRRLGYRMASEVHTVSESLRQHLLDHGFTARRITAVINGVDCDRFRPAADRRAAKEAAGFDGDDFVIGLVGRFIRSKRHELLLEAFRLLAESGPAFDRCRLLLLGDGGPEKDAVLAKIEAHPFSGRIRWAGHQDDTLPYYQAMDVQAMPSASEGLSNALLEGMACGVPALAHPACGASEVIVDGENGLLRAVETPAELAQCLSAIMGEPTLLDALSRAARSAAETRFSLASMVRGYADLYGRLAVRSSG